MKIVFRLNFHTIPGQSLWLKLATIAGNPGIRFEQVLPMRWVNDRQWQVEHQIEIVTGIHATPPRAAFSGPHCAQILFI